ncbi:MAG TPA: alanine--tRNA ligase-related protein, partial [Candidatus Limnocylindrales bacterium]|nr:alanine--tRNA ligase-related protein [Candidatus Limnocylindrales bacterium]
MPPPVQIPDPRIAALPAAEIRRRFVEFFAERGHTVVPSAGLVPAGDATLLFTNSGMVQFKDVFIGAETRSYTRAVDYQRCLRVAGKHNDFEEVGRTPRHHTLFEMLGNWSFGDYFKREAIHWAWDFLTRDLGIPGERLAATTYKDDEVARAIWRDEIGLPPERIARWGDVDAGDDHNFWRMADTGPCGPCSEIHFDRGIQFSEGPDCVPDHSETCPRWLEIWNLVFMEFDQRPDGRVPLPFPSVDTGMGLERLASVLQQVPTNYDTDLFTPIHARMRELIGHDPDTFEAERFSYQVIADHSRAVTFLIGDDVSRRPRRLERLARRDRPATRADGPLGRRRCRRRPQLLAHGGHRAVRAVQRDPLRPGDPVLRGTGVRSGPFGDLPALARDLEPGVHGVRPASGRPGAAAVHQRRHRDGSRAARQRPPAGPDQLRHGPVHPDPRPDARADRA